MKNLDLQMAVDALVAVTHKALKLIWDNTNKGQRKKLLRNEEIAALLTRYEINTEEE